MNPFWETALCLHSETVPGGDDRFPEDRHVTTVAAGQCSLGYVTRHRDQENWSVRFSAATTRTFASKSEAREYAAREFPDMEIVRDYCDDDVQ